MKRMKYFVLLLILLMSCKQYDKEIFKKGENNPQDKSVSEVIKEGEEVKKTPEESLIEKLDGKQKEGFSFLKEALGDEGKLNNLLGLDEAKVKGALDHIQTELAKCTGENASNGKGTFKNLVKAYFEGGSTDLDSFKKQAVSTCDANGRVGVGG